MSPLTFFVGVVLASSAQEIPSPDIYAIIVANNHSVDSQLSPLSYADDDGARWFELMSLGGKNIKLLSVLDRRTQIRHPAAAQVARTPTRTELDVALGEIFLAMKKARDQGLRTSFYFIYVGHGSVIGNDGGAMHLLDSYFTRDMLFEAVIKASPAATNHIIIDACNAYLMVASRGADPEDIRIEQAINNFLAQEYLGRYPNTGVLLATSSSRQVHEWSRYQAGIFSHEVRSAMAGAGDVDRDRMVTYSEVEAFVAAANNGIEDPSARLEVFAKPPQINLKEPVFSSTWIRQTPLLVVPERLAGRWWLEDGRGVRFADFHSEDDEVLTLALVPQSIYFLRNQYEEIPIPIQAHQDVFDASSLGRRPLRIFSRGSEALSFQKGLFSMPFGEAFYRGFVSSAKVDNPRMFRVPNHIELKKSGWGHQEWISTGLFAGAVGAGALSLAYFLEEGQAQKQLDAAIGPQNTREIENQIRQNRTLSQVFLGISGALLASGILSVSIDW